MLLIIGAAASQPELFADRVLEERGLVLSSTKVRSLLAGRVEEHELEARARELLEAAVLKRMEANQSVVVVPGSVDAADRQRFGRLGHGTRRPRHLIMLEAPPAKVSEDERPALDELRRALDAGELGAEGFQTVLRLGGAALTELKRIVFQPPPRED